MDAGIRNDVFPDQLVSVVDVDVVLKTVISLVALLRLGGCAAPGP